MQPQLGILRSPSPSTSKCTVTTDKSIDCICNSGTATLTPPNQRKLESGREGMDVGKMFTSIEATALVTTHLLLRPASLAAVESSRHNPVTTTPARPVQSIIYHYFA